MALFIDDTNRLIIPSWKQFDLSKTEVGISGHRNQSMKSNIQSYLLAWKENRHIVTAGDLITAAIVNDMTEDPAVQDAALYVVEYQQKAPEILKNASKGILDISVELDFFATAHLRIYEKIAQLKKLLSDYPTSAILHIEIARWYMVLGQLDIAEYHIYVALYLDANNRFVVRSAARFFIHRASEDRRYEMKAIEVLRNSNLTKKDPWLLASEISVSRQFKKRSPNLKRAVDLIESKNYSNPDLSELCGTMGMEELENAAYNKSRKLFNQSLIAANDNSFAQAQWVNQNRHLDLVFPNVPINRSFKEALCYEKFFSRDYKAALKYAQDWQDEMPYSQKCVVFGSNISTTFEKDYKTSIKLLETYLQTNKRNKAALNDLAYACALNNETEKAQLNVNLAIREMDANHPVPADICLAATQGLIYFREKDAQQGAEYYETAISACEKIRRDDMKYSATLNYAREILLFENSEANREKVHNMIKGIPAAEDGTELHELRKEVDKQLIEGTEDNN